MGEARQARNEGTRKLAAMIALKGGRIGKSLFLANWEPYCDKPVVIDRRIDSREAVSLATVGGVRVRDEVSAMEVSMNVPCRKCEKCLQFRQMQWRERAIVEIGRAKRTWWITLTIDPQMLANISMEARGTSTIDFEAAAYSRVQRYFKRLRKKFRKKADRILDSEGKVVGHNYAQFRYLAVFELGKKTGRPHYHLLLHETGTRPCLKAHIESQWRSNVHARLVGSGEALRRASYVTKYATKSFEISPRASVRYGKPTIPPKPKVLGATITLIGGEK